MLEHHQVRLNSLEDTQRLGEALARSVQVPLALALCGPLGAGKTELVRSVASYLGVPREQVTSPTYVLVQRYRGTIDIVHLDLYRLKSAEEVWDLGVDEWLAEPVLTILEWADKFPQVWPDDVLRCDLALDADGSRLAQFTASGQRATAVLQALRSAITG
jgi:tRNA threonylcarbamoyladenosine biosynthesis protein TsaE